MRTHAIVAILGLAILGPVLAPDRASAQTPIDPTTSYGLDRRAQQNSLQRQQNFLNQSADRQRALEANRNRALQQGATDRARQRAQIVPDTATNPALDPNAVRRTAQPPVPGNPGLTQQGALDANRADAARANAAAEADLRARQQADIERYRTYGQAQISPPRTPPTAASKVPKPPKAMPPRTKPEPPPG